MWRTNLWRTKLSSTNLSSTNLRPSAVASWVDTWAPRRGATALALLLLTAWLPTIGCGPTCPDANCDEPPSGPGDLPAYRVDPGAGGSDVQAQISPDAGASSAAAAPDAGLSEPTEPTEPANPTDAGVPPAPAADAGPPGFLPGTLEGGVPGDAALAPLPGAGAGGPVLTSNNPELVTGTGLLYTNARPLLTRGGQAHPLSGSFGVYLHHLVDTADGSPLWIRLVVSNPNATPVTLSVRGSGYSQSEVGGLGLGASPDYRVSEDWILDTPNVVVEEVTIEPGRPFAVWERRVGDYREVDGRFALQSDAPVFVYVVATATDDLNEAVRLSSGDERKDAPGDYRISGDPPPPFGREAGVYAFDTWVGDLDAAVPPAPAHAAWVVNTATGQQYGQVQAFPALVHLDGSAREAVGMYGNIYDLSVQLRHDGMDGQPRNVRVAFHSLSTAQISRYWDGLALVDGQPIHIRHVPGDASTTLAEVSLAPGEEQTLRFRAMVPGLTSISQALTVESR